MRTLNPAAAPLDSADAASRRWLHPLIFETLVAIDPAAGLAPRLAVSWASNAAFTNWHFNLRTGLKLHDGSPLDAGRVAAALQVSERSWRITSEAGTVRIETSEPVSDLPWLLTDVRYAIAFARPEGGEPIGTGPFAIDRWEPRRLRLRAHDEHWGGRPFLDAIQIDMGRSLAEQLMSAEAGRTDVIGLQAQDAQRATSRRLRVIATRPLELVAVVFEKQATGSASRPLRRALSLAIDRLAMCDVLLQRQGVPAAALLPDWLGGYAGLLPATVDRAQARSILNAVPPAQRTLMLANESDSLLRAIAERIAVDARDAGLSIVIPSGTTPAPRAPDVRLVRVSLSPTTPARALAGAVAELRRRRVPMSETAPGPLASLESVYQFERTLRDQEIVVPVVHLPELYAVRPHVESWREPLVLSSGAWNLANTFLRAGRP